MSPRAAVDPAPKSPAVAGPIPLLHRYHHTHLVLRRRILDGHYPRDSLLAGERQLAAEFGVARVTIRSALAALQREGLVRREQGRGTIVAGSQPRAAVAASEELDAFDVLFESILNIGQHSKARVLAMQTVPAPSAVANALALAVGAAVCRIVRLRKSLGDLRTVSYSTAWLPAVVTAGLTRRELGARPLLIWLQAQGLRVERADETLSACAADVDVAQALGVPVGSPLLAVRRTLLDQHGVPLMLFEGQFRPERYQYRLQLAREPRSARIRVVIDGA